VAPSRASLGSWLDVFTGRPSRCSSAAPPGPVLILAEPWLLLHISIPLLHSKIFSNLRSILGVGSQRTTAMRKLFGRTKNRGRPRHPAINSEYAPVADHGHVFPAVSQASQPAVQGNQTPVQASQVRPGEPFRSQGDELARNNDYNGALVMYNAALRSAPNDLSLLLSRSMAHSMVEPPNLDFALKDADRVIQSNPNWWQGWLQRGRVLLRRGDLQSAEEALTKATHFARGFNIFTAQRALDDVRACEAQATEINSVPAPEICTSPILPLQSSASGIASQTKKSSSTDLHATLNPSARASSPHESGMSTALLSVTSTSTSISSTPPPQPSSDPQSMGEFTIHGNK